MVYYCFTQIGWIRFFFFRQIGKKLWDSAWLTHPEQAVWQAWRTPWLESGMRKSLGSGMYPSKPAKRYTSIYILYYIYIEVQVCFLFEKTVWMMFGIWAFHGFPSPIIWYWINAMYIYICIYVYTHMYYTYTCINPSFTIWYLRGSFQYSERLDHCDLAAVEKGKWSSALVECEPLIASTWSGAVY